MYRFQEIFKKEFSVYFLVGGTATLIDWIIFAFGISFFTPAHYQMVLILALTCAGLFHYFANKILTFQCESKAVGLQIPIYIIVNLTGAGLSMLLMHLFVGSFEMNTLISRVLTTLLMLTPNYFMHKYMTFNKKIFSV